MPDIVTEHDRFPLLTASGRQMLDRLRQHPHAPRYNYHCGEKLSAAGLSCVRCFAESLRKSPSRWAAGNPPDWLEEYVATCCRDVPFYRDRTAVEFASLRPIDRDDLRREPWSFVPDSADLSELIVYSTSGTTGNLVKVICDPTVPASYLPLIEFAAASRGVRIEGGDRVSIVHVAAQVSTYTLASVMSYFDSAGFAKVNLHPSEWNSPGDREVFLDDCAPEIVTGDPFALVAFAELNLKTKPKAIVSSATTLLPAVRRKLEEQFECPVIDMVSMNESGPIAFSTGGPHQIFPHRLYVEIVDTQGRAVESGEFGEIVLTGGINPYLPLLRYRTGDFAALDFTEEQPALSQFTGRTPVDFIRSDGAMVRSIDVVVALFKIPLAAFRLHQHADGRLKFQTRCDESTKLDIHERLVSLFGDPARLDVEQMPPDIVRQGKAIQFTSDMEQSQ